MWIRFPTLQEAWLLLAGRHRTLPVAYEKSVGVPGGVPTGERGRTGAVESISDIVAFYDPGVRPTFDHSGVVGPILLVDSLEALPFAASKRFRCWLSVPSAAFAEDPNDPGKLKLFVYYVVEDAWKSLARATPDPPLYDDVDVVYRRRAHQAYFGGSFEDNGRGIAVKRLDAQNLARVFTPSPGSWPTSELSWTANDAWHGDLLGHVRWWLPGASSGMYVVPWESEYASSYEDPDSGAVFDSTPIAVDPAATSCDGELFLYCARILKNQPGDNTASSPVDDIAAGIWQDTDRGTVSSGHGIWRAAAIPGGLSFVNVDDSSIVPTIFGVDFVSRRPNALTHASPDQLVISGINPGDLGGNEQLYNTDEEARMDYDPDPFEHPMGGWALLAGSLRFGFDLVADSGWAREPAGTNYGLPDGISVGAPLRLFEDEPGGACISWSNILAGFPEVVDPT